MNFVTSLVRKRYSIDGQEYISEKGCIGEGAFAVVNRVRHNKTNKEFAVKRILCSTLEQVTQRQIIIIVFSFGKLI